MYSVQNSRADAHNEQIGKSLSSVASFLEAKRIETEFCDFSIFEDFFMDIFLEPTKWFEI